MGRYIVGYSRNFCFTLTCERSHKTWFPTVYLMIFLPKWKFWIWFTHSNALLQFRLKKEHCMPHEAARHPTKCDVINDIKLFFTVYQRIYCCKYLTLSMQMSRYKIKYIRILYYPLLSRSLQFYSLIMKVFSY